MPSPSESAARGGRRQRVGDRGRVLLVAALVLIVGLIIGARFFAGFYVDYLWHISLGRGDVFWGILRTKVLLFVLFAGAFSAMAIVNLLIADRLSPVAFSANVHPAVERFHDFFGRRLRLFRIVVAVVIGMLFAAPAIGRWQEWLMFRNSKGFGITDPQFGHDIGFYLFKLPFVTFLLDWLFAALIFITLLTLATHILNGGIVFAAPRPRVRNSAKAHIAVLLAAIALVKAADYWVQRYELTASNQSNIVRGATYTVVNATLPAIVLLGLIAVLTAGLFLSTLKTGSWRLPLIASGLWAVMALVGGIIYPSVIQALVVNPNQRDREALYIERNIDATRHALGIDNVQKIDYQVEDLTTAEVKADTSSLQNVRLLKADGDMVTRFRTDQTLRTGLTINDLDIDRYEKDGREQQTVVAARELDLNSIANKTWQGKHLISTHGCGLVAAPAGQADSNGRPVYTDVELTRPELYYSDDISGYAIVNTEVSEEICPGQTDPGAYTGEGGVLLDSPFKRLAFALDYLDYNLIGSSAVNNESRLISTRRVQDRVRALAPFLELDGDPYPVALGGRVLWVVDAYTTSDLYPYGQNGDRTQLTSTSGLNKPFNYIRNSVKAVVDAYDGSTTLYVVDQTDPVVQVWESAFPGLFRPQSDMPDGLVNHLRYPEELFRVQTAAYSKYQLPPSQFFNRDGAWSIAQAPVSQAQAAATAATASATQATDQNNRQQQAFTNESTSAKFVPYYTMFQAPGQTASTFELYRPFVKFSNNDDQKALQAFMTASSDPDTYGQLRAYTVTNTSLPNGPLDVANAMAQDPQIAQQVTLIEGRDSSSTVSLGDLQMMPVSGGIVWLRPMFTNAKGTSQVLMKFVLASYNGSATYGESTGEALRKLFTGFDVDIGDRISVPGELPDESGGGNGEGSTPSTTVPSTTAPTDTTPPGSGAQTPDELLAEANRLFAEADTALQAGELGTYQQKVDEARQLVQRAFDLMQASTSTTSTSVPPDSTSTAAGSSSPPTTTA